MGSNPFFIDLPKDRRLVFADLIPPTQHTNRLAPNLASKRQLGSWSNADRDARIFRRRKSSRARAKVSRRQLVANIRRAGFDAVKAVVTHLGTPLWEAPQPIQSYPLSPSSALVCVTRVPCYAVSALGQKQTLGHLRSMSALPPKADIAEGDRHVRFVPKADIATIRVTLRAAGSSPTPQ